LGLLALLTLLPALRAGPSTLDGVWTGCLLTDGQKEDLCGEVVIDTLEHYRVRGDHPVYFYRVRHQLQLDQLRGAYGVPATPYGIIFTDEASSYHRLVLGLKENSFGGWDGGQIFTDLTGSQDSLFGRWHRTCFVECPETGQVILRRSRSR
jgi:hypothetical protein